VPCDQLARPFQQGIQNLKGLSRQTHRPVLSAELAGDRIELEVAESDGRRSRVDRSNPSQMRRMVRSPGEGRASETPWETHGRLSLFERRMSQAVRRVVETRQEMCWIVWGVGSLGVTEVNPDWNDQKPARDDPGQRPPRCANRLHPARR